MNVFLKNDELLRLHSFLVHVTWDRWSSLLAIQILQSVSFHLIDFRLHDAKPSLVKALFSMHLYRSKKLGNPVSYFFRYAKRSGRFVPFSI